MGQGMGQNRKEGRGRVELNTLRPVSVVQRFEETNRGNGRLLAMNNISIRKWSCRNCTAHTILHHASADIFENSFTNQISLLLAEGLEDLVIHQDVYAESEGARTQNKRPTGSGRSFGVLSRKMYLNFCFDVAPYT